LFGKSSCRRFFEKEVKTGKSPTKLLDSSIEVDIEITHALIIFCRFYFFFFLPRATGGRQMQRISLAIFPFDCMSFSYLKRPTVSLLGNRQR
jgi:hypothetical protein